MKHTQTGTLAVQHTPRTWRRHTATTQTLFGDLVSGPHGATAQAP